MHIPAAQADEEQALAWGLLGGEMSMAGVFALNFGVDGYPNSGPAFALNFAPLLIGPAAGYAAHHFDWDARPAYAMHGAAALGFDLFMLGTLIDGRREQDGIRMGTSALVLGAAGTLAGAWIGGTQIDGMDEATAFYAAPLTGLVVGGLVIGGIAAVASNDTNKAFQRFVMGAVGGLTLGIGASLIFAYAQDAQASAASTPRVLPAVNAGDGRVIFSFGGAL